MRYSKMVDLIERAKKAGFEDTEVVNELLEQQFENWLHSQHLGEVTDEEEDRLRLAFEEGYGICMHGL